MIREHCGVEEDIVTKTEKGLPNHHGHVQIMNESRLTKQILNSSVSGQVYKGRPIRTYHDKIEDVRKVR